MVASFPHKRLVRRWSFFVPIYPGARTKTAPLSVFFWFVFVFFLCAASETMATERSLNLKCLCGKSSGLSSKLAHLPTNPAFWDRTHVITDNRNDGIRWGWHIVCSMFDKELSKRLSFLKVFCKKSSATNRRRHQMHIVVGKQAEQKQTDRMTHSRLCFSPECDTPPPPWAVSLETCWHGREVKRQLNVLASLDKFTGTVVLRGVKFKKRLVTSTSTGKGQNSISLCTSCSLRIHLTCTAGLSEKSSE